MYVRNALKNKIKSIYFYQLASYPLPCSRTCICIESRHPCMKLGFECEEKTHYFFGTNVLNVVWSRCDDCFSSPDATTISISTRGQAGQIEQLSWATRFKRHCAIDSYFKTSETSFYFIFCTYSIVFNCLQYIFVIL